MHKKQRLSENGPVRRWLAACCVTTLLLTACAADEQIEDSETADESVAAGPICQMPEFPAVEAPPMPSCDNDKLTSYDGLLVLAPHPDDEVLGFAGLITAYMAAGKPVEVVVTTDGDAYCEACRFWKSSSMTGSTCSAEDFSNFETDEIDSFAEVRRKESADALAILGAPAPDYFGYPDTGLGAAWANSQAGELDKPLRRSDFSMCESCETCPGGYGEGPETELTASTLTASLSERLESVSTNTLVATTHWLDGHGDHAGLGHFVKTINAGLDSPRPVAYGVIHAHTPKDQTHADCWYPGPAAPLCACMQQDCADQDPKWIAGQREYRYRPDWPAVLPDDTDYGPESQLCIAEELYQGDGALKRAAIDTYTSQLGFLARDGEHPENLAGMIDCSGYLISFVRTTEPFVLVEPSA